MHQLARTKAEEEERIAAVLQQRMHDSERKTKELQQLRNESADLRDLQVSMHWPTVNGWDRSALRQLAQTTANLCWHASAQLYYQSWWQGKRDA